MDDLELCRLLRAELHVPSISIAAAPATMDEPSAALDGGADDYLAQPFAVRELGACVRAIPDGRPGSGRATIGGTIVWRGAGQPVNLSINGRVLRLIWHIPGSSRAPWLFVTGLIGCQ